ncbi:uncharacterized protein LOC126744878 [Anthonomus grandis grandis]|uniref:uncharacterized protein LOC126744878 n=1 Tax=Anthonomus grandis grandis TaxID=2921223 RepID=UPI002165A6BA|nr:uncharacterized protein LOC126744878 [Anthonomus grandis grandis]
MECDVCKKNSSQIEIFACDGCKTRLCRNEVLSLINASEYKVLQLKSKRHLKFYCEKCTKGESFSLYQSLIEEKQKHIEAKEKIISCLETNNKELLQKIEMLEKKLQNTQNESKGTFSVVLIKPVDEQDGILTKKEIRQNVDPSKIEVSKFRQIKGGGVVIGCSDKNQIKDLRTQLEKQLGQKYTVEVPSLKKPKMKIVNINKDDVGLEDSDSTIIDLIVKWNNLFDGEDFYMKVLKKSVNNFKNINLILEADSITHNKLLSQERVKLGWSRCRVFNHVSVLQCFNCMGFNHYGKDCKSQQICSRCSGNHSYKECRSNEKKCINCIKSKKPNENLDVSHEALSRECPCLLRIISLYNKKVDYLSDCV